MDRNLAARAAHWSATHRKAAILGWLAFVVVGVMLGGAVGQKEIHGADQFSGEAGRAEQTLEEAGLRPNSESVLVQSRTLAVGDREFRTAVDQLTSRLSDSKYVTNVVNPLTGGGAISRDRRSALVEFEITGDDLEAKDRLEPAKDAVADVQDAHEGRLRVEQFGSVSANKEITDTFTEDLLKAETLSFPLTLAILILAFGTLVAALVPLFVGMTAVIAAMALVALPSQLSPVDSNISSVILLIGLAVGVDYSLFYLRREREERARGREPRSALHLAAATSGRAVLISGLTVMAAMAGMFLSGDKTFFSFAEGTILVVAIAMFASLTVLPAMLAWLGDRIEKGRVPVIGRRRPAGESRFWSTVVERVMRRPWLAIAIAGGLLVALAIPALNMKIVVSGVDDLPQDLAVIQTYDRLRDAFPAEGVTVDVALKGDDVRTGAASGSIAELRRRAERTEGVTGPPEATYSSDGKAALIAIPTAGNGNDATSTAALDRIRDEVIPSTVGGVDGLAADVSGDAAQSKDFSALLTSRLPLIFGFVFALTFVLMLFTFRSIVIPIKAILLNLLSVGAAYGVLVLVFQEGLGESLLGFTSTGGVTSWLPLFLFVILFGLSMDYHVFILSRVREAYQSGMSTAEAVRHGISTTAGTVTSAAIVMVVVFSVFVTLSFIDMKQMGVGLAVAVLFDATIVRGVLLPASMKVLGEWNWYLPRWLEWIPQGHRGEPPDAEADAEADAEPRVPALH